MDSLSVSPPPWMAAPSRGKAAFIASASPARPDAVTALNPSRIIQTPASWTPHVTISPPRLTEMLYMARTSTRTNAKQHRQMAAELFNGTWKLLSKKRRTKEETNTMIHMAHASRYHWGVVGGPKELAIGEWQISRVYAVLRRPEPALYHAQRALEICEASEIGDFPLAYAYEALARAFAIAGKSRLRTACLKLAKVAGAKIAEADERSQFFKG